MKETMRIDKYLSEMREGTRSQIKEMAKKGRISVNGVPEKQADRKIVPGQDEIKVDGQVVAYAAYEYYMLNKPQDVVSATEDKRHTTVVSLIEERKRDDLFPVGRLDIDTEGLLLITNDGDLAHQLLTPKKHVDKTYYAKVEGLLPSDAIGQMNEGIVLLDGTKTRPADLKILKLGNDDLPTEILLTIHEGKFHQVKRMFETLGCHVVYLKRLSIGNLKLDDSLSPGQYRALTEAELHILKKTSQE